MGTSSAEVADARALDHTGGGALRSGPLLAVALMALSLLLWGLTSPHGLTRKLPDNDLGWGVALACAMAAVATVGGRWVSIRLARRRRVRLLAFLADPTRG